MTDGIKSSFEIELLSGPHDGELARLDSSETIIGCEAGLDVPMSYDTVVAKRHARIRCSGGRISIEDLGSSHGTFVNGEEITGTRVLCESDIVRVGRTEFVCRPPRSEGVRSGAASKVAETRSGP